MQILFWILFFYFYCIKNTLILFGDFFGPEKNPEEEIQIQISKWQFLELSLEILNQNNLLDFWPQYAPKWLL